MPSLGAGACFRRGSVDRRVLLVDELDQDGTQASQVRAIEGGKLRGRGGQHVAGITHRASAGGGEGDDLAAAVVRVGGAFDQPDLLELVGQDGGVGPIDLQHGGDVAEAERLVLELHQHAHLAAAGADHLSDPLGVTYTPIRDMEFGYHLNFRDPDDIALELSAPNDLLLAAKQALADGRTSQADIAAFVADNDLDLPNHEKH